MRRALIAIVAAVGLGLSLAGAGALVTSSAEAPREVEFTLEDLELIASKVTLSLQFDGKTGPANDTEHAAHAPVASMAWGVSLPFEPGGGGGGGTGKPQVSELTLTHALDTYSPEFVDVLAKGIHTPKATLYAMSGKNLVFKIEMEELLVTSYQLNASSGAVPSESLSLHFATMSFTVTGSATVPELLS